MGSTSEDSEAIGLELYTYLPTKSTNLLPSGHLWVLPPVCSDERRITLPIYLKQLCSLCSAALPTEEPRSALLPLAPQMA